MAIAIKAENLSKAYQLGEFSTGTLSRDIERWWARLRGKEDPFLRIGETNDRTSKGTSDIVWSLKDIDFEIEQGAAVGIIGRNGAGKSTLLKVLSRVTMPTTGSVKVKGRVASLLEVGTGFHPELTGRENIFLNGAILGMRKVEIKKHFDAIVDFAGVERYVDTPVKRYSSGMYVRLAFAVAAHLESEILIVDEVLAVGDAEFQKKCLGKMGEVSKSEGRTVLFVSHNMASIEKLCQSAIYLANGRINDMGITSAVIDQYISLAESVQDEYKVGVGTYDIKLAERVNIPGNKLEKVFSRVKILNKNKQESDFFKCGEDILVHLEYEAGTILKNPKVGIIIEDEKENRIGFVQTLINHGPIESLPSNGALLCQITNPNLTPGIYSLTIGMSIGNMQLDLIERKVYFEVISTDYFGTGNLPPTTHGKSLFKANWLFN